jgi:hypothetical protein
MHYTANLRTMAIRALNARYAALYEPEQEVGLVTSAQTTDKIFIFQNGGTL